MRLPYHRILPWKVPQAQPAGGFSRRRRRRNVSFWKIFGIMDGIPINIREISARAKELLAALTALWEASVRSIHNFLSELDSFENSPIFNIKSPSYRQAVLFWARYQYRPYHSERVKAFFWKNYFSTKQAPRPTMRTKSLAGEFSFSAFLQAWFYSR